MNDSKYRVSDIAVAGGVRNNTARSIVLMADPLAFVIVHFKSVSSVVLQNDMI
jgi:hypothetical protein